MSTIRTKILVAAIALMLPGTAFAQHMHAHGTGDIEIESAYSRAMLPVAKVGGGYLTINNSGEADRLVGAKSDRAGEVQIHEMKMNGAVMEMRELDNGIPVPARSTVELAPGGYHLMFMNVPKAFKEGETLKATLIFEKAGPIEVEFAVGPVAGGQKPHAAHGDHD
jgi:copper(I)-binding protein